MPATSTSIESLTCLNEAVRLAADPDGPPPRDLAHAIGEHRSRMADHAEAIDSALVISIRHLANGLKQSEARIAELAGIVSDLASDPWPAAIYLRSVGRDHAGTPSRAEVLATGNRRVVLGIDRSRVDPSTLVPGQKVYLNAKGSAIMMAESSDAGEATGDTAVFVRWLDPETRRRLIVRQHNDEEVIAEAACPPDELEALKPGNRVRFLREAQIVCEKIAEPEASDAPEFSATRRTRATRADIGGQAAAYDQLEMTVFGALIDPSRAARYGLSGRKVVLLSGPPGTGKTLLAKVVATEMEERFQRPCHFASVKPGEFSGSFVGQTEEAIRRFFADCRRLAQGGLVVAFLDEIEALGRHRGVETAHHSDRALAAFLAEVDGTEACPNLCIICATNRKDLLDTALASRISEEIHIGRPDAKGAREILGIHMGPDYAYSPNGSESAATRNHAIERAIALLFGNSEESEIACVRFADGKSRIVRARELVSGRLIQQIANAASRTALTRDIRYGDPGIRLEDVEAGVAEAFAKMRSSLTRHSIHAYLEDLPQDIAVVAVEPIVPKVPDRHRYRVHA